MDEKDLVPITPRDVLVKLGTSAVAYLAGVLGMAVLSGNRKTGRNIDITL